MSVCRYVWIMAWTSFLDSFHPLSAALFVARFYTDTMVGILSVIKQRLWTVPIITLLCIRTCPTAQVLKMVPIVK